MPPEQRFLTIVLKRRLIEIGCPSVLIERSDCYNVYVLITCQHVNRPDKLLSYQQVGTFFAHAFLAVVCFDRQARVRVPHVSDSLFILHPMRRPRHTVPMNRTSALINGLI